MIKILIETLRNRIDRFLTPKIIKNKTYKAFDYLSQKDHSFMEKLLDKYIKENQFIYILVHENSKLLPRLPPYTKRFFEKYEYIEDKERSLSFGHKYFNYNEHLKYLENDMVIIGADGFTRILTPIDRDNTIYEDDMRESKNEEALDLYYLLLANKLSLIIDKMTDYEVELYFQKLDKGI